MAGQVTVEMLGGLRIRLPGGAEAEAWVRPSAKHLFCLVLLTPGRSVARADAGRMLFPGLSPERAANGVAKSSTWCRQALGLPAGEGLVATGGVLRCEVAVVADVDVPLDLVRAGTTPDDVDGLRALADDDRVLLPGWEGDWLDVFRDEVSRARSAAGETLARRLEVRALPDDLDESARRWQALVDDDPLDESRQAGLLRSLATAGRWGEARTAYTVCRSVLWSQLQVEPGPEVESAWRRVPLLSDDLELSSRRSGLGIPSATPGPAVPGRGEVVDEIEAALGAAELGAGSSALVTGEAGIGKSAVLTAVADRYRSRGWRVVDCAGRTTSSPGYSTLGPALLTLTEGTRQASMVAGLLAPGRPGARVPETRPGTSERSLQEQLGDALEAAASVPTLLVVDDLHAADPASVRLLRALSARAGVRHWSLLSASRVDPGPWHDRHVALGPLPEAVVEDIIRRRCPDRSEESVREAAERCEGNPLFAGEIAHLLSSTPDRVPLPPSAVQLLRQRLATLPGPHRILVPLIVLAGHEATWPVLALAMPDLDLDADLALIAEQLRRSDLVVEQEGRLRACHPLIGEAALVGLGRAERATLHDRLADALGRLGDGGSESRHRRAAFDALPEVGRAGLALPAAVDAARRALEQGAHTEAAELARCALRAWALCPATDRERQRSAQLDAHLMLGHALAATSTAQADAAYENGVRAADDDDARARFVLARGWLHYSHGEHSRAAHLYQQGLDLPDLSPVAHSSLATSLGWVLARQGLFERGLQLIETGLEGIDPVTHPEVVAYGLDRRGMTLAFLGRLTDAQASLDRAFELAIRTDAVPLLAGIQIHRGGVCGRLGEWDPALRYLDEAVELTRTVNDAYTESVAWWGRTDVLTRHGDRAAALAANREEERVLRLLGNSAHLAACLRRRQNLQDPAYAPAGTAGRTP